MRLGEKIKKYRKKKKLTLEALANVVGTSRGYIWELENNEKIKSSGEMLKKIAEQLDVTVDFLLSPKLIEPEEDEEALVFGREVKSLSPQLQQAIKSQIKAFKELEKDKE